jgi:hypothetical protein
MNEYEETKSKFGKNLNITKLIFNMSPLQELQQKIIKAVPDIESVRFVLCQDKLETVNFGCQEEYHKTVGRPITLEDVLMTCYKNKIELDYCQYNDGKSLTFWKAKFGITLREIRKERVIWLLNTPLHLQSEETISEINKLIK